VFHAQQRTEDIGVEGRGVTLGCLVRYHAGLPFGAGVVDGRVQATELGNSLIDQVAYIVFAARRRQ
jgi:hypothetical protein